MCNELDSVCFQTSGDNRPYKHAFRAVKLRLVCGGLHRERTGHQQLLALAWARTDGRAPTETCIGPLETNPHDLFRLRRVHHASFMQEPVRFRWAERAHRLTIDPAGIVNATAFLIASGGASAGNAPRFETSTQRSYAEMHLAVWVE